jgi:LysM repeat protein
MSKGGMKEFLAALFSSEGGGKSKIVNKHGYVGKYQFGESALADLGYYKPDGSSPYIETADNKKFFKYQWKGTWTGKDGINSLDDFLNSADEQDIAAVLWVKHLCTHAHSNGAVKYEGKTMAGVKITHSGIIAGAHLKGFGTKKHPGVMAFLESNGATDPSDAYGTKVSDYISKFADYDLGCCQGSLNVAFLDANRKPIPSLKYEIRSSQKVLQQGVSAANGKIQQLLEGVHFTNQIEVWIEKMEGGLKQVWDGTVKASGQCLTLISPKILARSTTELHPGSSGSYKRISQRGGYTVKSGDSLWKIANQNGTTVADLKKANPTISGNTIQPGQSINLPGGASGSSQAAPTPQAPAASATQQNTQPSPSTAHADAPVAANASAASSSPAAQSSSSPNTKPQATPVNQERNKSGHPVAVAKSDTPPPTGDPKQRMLQIIQFNVNYGSSKVKPSGPAAVKRAEQGQPISDEKKPANKSLGRCYLYVKVALQASGMTKSYLGQAAAQDAGPELAREGFHNIFSGPGGDIKSPYDAPVGSVIVYGTTDNSPWGHIEIRTPTGFASDYASNNSRVMRVGEKPTLEGRGRKVIGVWVK